MRPGDVIGGRFVVEALAGEGGIGVVYRAIDRELASPVALKVLKSSADRSEQRFAREASVLSELDHPSIVTYVAHGQTESGRLYLVMEWLDGETLEQRMARHGLTPQEAIDLVRRVAAALGQAHRRGIVHRDLKPSNLFLVGKRLDAVRILDFGVARVKAQSSLTRTGVPVGTPSYMAPEQARGASEIDARADVFALGCVLFECLTGRQAFPGEQAVAVLARVMFEPPPRLSELRPELPDKLEALLTAMLAKNPALRLKDGEAVASALDIVEDTALSVRAPVAPRPPMLTHAEQKLVSLVVVADDCAFDDQTLPEAEVATQTDLLQAVADFYGARFEFVAGAKMLTFLGHGSAMDQAAQAARSALELSTRMDAPVALATGWAVLAGHVPVGEVLERALALAAGARGAPQVHVDEATAGLLATRFALSDDRRLLFHERGADEPAHLLLGQLTPCVGRERELKMLEAIARECAAGPIASAVLVTGPPGIGKSRVKDELLVRLQASGPAYLVWSARGEAMKRGFSFELLRGIVKSAAGISVEDAPDVVRAKLAERMGAARAAPLSRLIVGDDGERRPEVHAIDALRLAWLELVDEVTRQQALLISLDDVHLADTASLGFVDAALERLEERPLCVIALGRHDVHKAFPKLWNERAVQEIRLPELTRRASEELARAVLGGDGTDELVARVAEHAGGNAFVLEELLRTARQGGNLGLPRSTVAVAQARLERLEPEARRVLKAASAFGESFWLGGVQVLLGPSATHAERTLASLEAREIVRRQPESRFAGEREYAFRHSLLREAAYALLTDDDRSVAHRLLAEWLEAHGESNAGAVAEHFELGGEPRRAIAWWRRAAEQALAADEFATAVARAERGIAAGAHGAALGELSVTLGEAARWLGDLERADFALGEARALLGPGSALWCTAAREHAVVLQRLGRASEAAVLASELRETSPAKDADVELALARVRGAMALSYLGREELAEGLMRAVSQETPLAVRALPIVEAMISRRRCDELARRGAFAEYLAAAEAAVDKFRAAGLERQAVSETVTVGYALLELGAYERAERVLTEAAETATELGLVQPAAVARQNLGLVLARLGRLDAARDAELACIETFTAQGERRMEGATRIYLALVLVHAGELAAAEAEARRALAVLEEVAPPLVPEALATLAHVLLAAGRAEEALPIAESAHARLEAESVESGEALIRLVTAEALLRTGNETRGRELLSIAKARVEERAAAIGDAELRKSFVERVPENARTLKL